MGEQPRRRGHGQSRCVPRTKRKPLKPVAVWTGEAGGGPGSWAGLGPRRGRRGVGGPEMTEHQTSHAFYESWSNRSPAFAAAVGGEVSWMTCLRQPWSPGSLLGCWGSARGGGRAPWSPLGPRWAVPHGLCHLICVPQVSGKTRSPREEPKPPCPEPLRASLGRGRQLNLAQAFSKTRITPQITSSGWWCNRGRHGCHDAPLGERRGLAEPGFEA